MRLQYGEEMERNKVVSAAKYFLIGSDNDFGTVLVNESRPIGTEKRYFNGSCFGCSRKGHRKQDCRNFCSNCSNIGHSAPFCHNKVSENSQM